MSYIENNLGTKETVLLKAGVHWSIFIGPALGLIGSFGLAMWGSGSAFFIIALFPLLLFTVNILRAIIYKFTTELAITNRRVIAKTGLISRDVLEINIRQAEGLQIRQSILGRILNYGTVLIGGSGGATAPLRNIDAPLAFRKAVINAVDGVY